MSYMELTELRSMLGSEAQARVDRYANLMSEAWKRDISNVVYFVHEGAQ